MDPIGALLSGGLSLAGGLMSNVFSGQRQQEAQQFNAAQVQQMEQYQTQMSNTAYQRATADMKAAGLNPILAYARGGASAPSGGAATTSPVPFSDVLTPAVNSAMAKSRLDSDMQSAVAQRDATNASTDATRESIVNTQLQRPLIAAQTASEMARRSNIDAQTQYTLSQAASIAANAERGKLDAGVLSNPLVQKAREFGTGSAEVARSLTSGIGGIIRGMLPSWLGGTK